MKRMLILSYGYIAAIIGAGFASGQEILCFFVKYGRNGFYGIALSAFIFSLIIFLVSDTCMKRNIFSYSDFLDLISSRKLSLIIRIVSGMFAAALFAAMLAAVDNMGVMLFSIPKGAFSLITAVICIFLFFKKSGTVLSANGVIGIMITIGIICCTLYMLYYREFHVFSETFKSIGSSYIYSGYNLISIIPIIVISSRSIRNRAEAAAVSFISGSTIFIMMLLMFAIIAIYFNKINLGEIPMLTLAIRQSTLFSFVYALLLTASIITTLFSSGEAFIESFKLKNKNILICLFVICSYALSSVGLTEIINYGYRFFGIIGSAVISYMIFKLFKIRRLN